MAIRPITPALPRFPQDPGPDVYTIKNGDSTWAIWQTKGGNDYCSWVHFQSEFTRLNPSVDPAKLKLNTSVHLPAAKPQKKPSTPAQPPQPPPGASTKFHTLSRGENIAAIAEQNYQSLNFESAYALEQVLLSLNRIQDEKRLQIGQMIWLPPALPPEPKKEAVLATIRARVQTAPDSKDSNLLLGCLGESWFPIGKHVNKGFSYIDRHLTAEAYFEVYGESRKIAPDDQQAVIAVCRCEGPGFGSINTAMERDRSFGCLQWNGIPHTLDTLLLAYASSNPSGFQRNFGSENIGFNERNTLVIHQIKFPIKNSEKDALLKEVLATDWFATVFSRAACDPTFQHAQIDLALHCLKEARRTNIDGIPVSTLVTSAVGHALLLSEYIKGQNEFPNFLAELETDFKECIGKPDGEANFLKALCKKSQDDRVKKILTYFNRQDLAPGLFEKPK